MLPTKPFDIGQGIARPGAYELASDVPDEHGNRDEHDDYDGSGLNIPFDAA